MDPLRQKVEQSQVTPSPPPRDDIDGSGSRSESCLGVVIDRDRDMVLELGSESRNGFVVDGDNLNDFDEPDDEFFVETRDLGLEFQSDIRLITVESGSDDGVEDEREIWGIDLNEEEDVYVSDEDEDDVSVTIPLCWDSLQFDDRGVTTEEFDWEEVDGGGVGDEREILSTFAEADIEDDDTGISISVSATGEREEGSGNVGWEVLLNAQTLEINFNAEHREIYIVGEHDDHIHTEYIPTTEYETLFEQFAEAGLMALRFPPTSESFVENLPMVPLEVAKDEGAVCAVCKEDMNIGNKAVQLPCNHKYHSECIVPWLKVRNTCPVCRHEMPTDDIEYEERKSLRRTTTTTTTSDDLVL